VDLSEQERKDLDGYVARAIASAFESNRHSLVTTIIDAVLEWLEKHKGGENADQM
jgi:hypothetical protein